VTRGVCGLLEGMKLNCRRCGKGRPVWTQLCKNCVEQAIATLDWDAAFAKLLGGRGVW
jgi:hypothetical protein